MKKITSLGLILCACITSNTVVGMYTQQLKRHTKLFSAQQKRCYGHPAIYHLTAMLDKQNYLINEQTSLLRETNRLLQALNNNPTEESPKKEKISPTNQSDDLFKTKYAQEMDAYHSSRLPQE